MNGIACWSDSARDQQIADARGLPCGLIAQRDVEV
jgi:hypothetical protein